MILEYELKANYIALLAPCSVEQMSEKTPETNMVAYELKPNQ